MGSKSSSAGPLIEGHGTELQTVAPAPVDGLAAFAQTLERLAANPDADIAKFEKLIELNERLLRSHAESAFEEAYSRMQPEIPEIDEKGRILNRDGTVRSRYSRLEDIQSATKPILARHGFTLRHKTEWPADKPGIIRIVGILGHALGHKEFSTFEAPADKSDFRTDIQSQGSTVSYGRRYTSIDLLNIVTRGVDNDGATAGRPEPPDGYEKWAVNLETTAVKGMQAFEAAWNVSDGDPSLAKFKTYLVNHDKERHKAMKAVAAGKRS